MYVRIFDRVRVCVRVYVCVHVCVSSLPVHWFAVPLHSPLPWFRTNWTECEWRREVMGESRRMGDGGEVGHLEGAVCHCESAQGGSHHLAIDGCPSPVVKQAPVGLPEHWGHCVSSLTGNIPPKVLLPPPLSNPWHPEQFSPLPARFHPPHPGIKVGRKLKPAGDVSVDWRATGRSN